MIEVGSFVRYKASDDEPPVPALVQTVWEDGSGYELYVFHFTSQSHVRSAHPSQVEEVGSNKDQSTRIDELNEDLAALAARVTDLEEDNAMLRAELNSLSPRPIRDITDVGKPNPEPIQVDASELIEEVPAPAVDSGVESTQTEDVSHTVQEEDLELVPHPDDFGGTATPPLGKNKGNQRKRSAWPNE